LTMERSGERMMEEERIMEEEKDYAFSGLIF
jgi:hypothetical protein